MSCTSAGNNEISRFERELRPVRVADRDLWPGLQCDPRLLRQDRIDLDGRDLSPWPDEFGHDRSIIPGAATEVQDLLASGNVELVEQKSPQARLRGTAANAARRAAERTWAVKRNSSA